MTKIQQNSLESVVLNNGGRNFKLWSSCRRKIINTMSCGGGGGYRHRHSPVKENSPEKLPEKKRSDVIKIKKSEKLSELLKMSEMMEEEEEEVKKKVEVLEELKAVVKRLQCGGNDGVLSGAVDVRRLAKDDCDARSTLALLGAIPPLVAVIDSGDLDSRIAALYALLNLGIGNDT